MNMERPKLFIPGPSSRFFPYIKSYLEENGIAVQAHHRQLVTDSEKYRIHLSRGFDIPKYIEAGWGDLGITGLDAVHESRSNVQVVGHLGIRYSKVVVASKKIRSLDEIEEGDLIATEYDVVARDFFKRVGINNINLLYVTGGVESVAEIDEVKAIVTLVTSGESLENNKINLVHVIMDTYACLVSPQHANDARDERIRMLSHSLPTIDTQGEELNYGRC